MKNIVIVGGCGHVGIPLGLALSTRNFNVTLLDVNEHAVSEINSLRVPFMEKGADEILRAHIGKNLSATCDKSVISGCDVIVFVTGTPVDEHLNPRVSDVLKAIKQYLPLMNKDQLIILRSTLFPGTIPAIDKMLTEALGSVKLAFCPERILQGKGIEEIFTLPQLVSATSQEAEDEAAELFGKLTPKVIRLTPEEAELAKLMTNTWRYLEFAIADQFYMMVTERGLDFHKIFRAMKEDYPRAKNFASPGLAAGPCLFKDTMQMAAFHNNNFFLGHAAMLVNEGMPNFLVGKLKSMLGGSLRDKKVAILGMTFKADNDDIRESLSFKIKKLLELEMAEVMPSDPFLKDTYPMEQALAEADAVILGVPHSQYRAIVPSQPFIDCWGVWERKESRE